MSGVWPRTSTARAACASAERSDRVAVRVRGAHRSVALDGTGIRYPVSVFAVEVPTHSTSH